MSCHLCVAETRQTLMKELLNCLLVCVGLTHCLTEQVALLYDYRLLSPGMMNISTLRCQRGVVKASITSLAAHVMELEGKVHIPTTLSHICLQNWRC